MLARLHTIETTSDDSEQYELGLRILRDEVLPCERESTGFRIDLPG